MRLSYEWVEAAARLIDPVFLGLFQFIREPLGEALGMSLTLKVETLNQVRCFKGRTGKLISHRTMNTIADGIGVRNPIPEALADLS